MLNLIYFSSIDSTQVWLTEKIRQGGLDLPVCVLSDRQDRGIGSRNNAWRSVENALTFSFAFCKSSLPSDLPMQSISIYVGYLLKEWLKEFDVWLKWPNDLYLGEEKIGGIMTQCLGDAVVCGIGINLKDPHMASLGVSWGEEDKKEKVFSFVDFLFKFPTWSEIFTNYKLEFHRSFAFTFHFENRKISFRDVELCEDGSVFWMGKKIYGLR